MGNEEVLFNGYSVSVWEDEKLWTQTVVMVTQVVSVIHTTELDT